jgi:hypothetical protein
LVTVLKRCGVVQADADITRSVQFTQAGLNKMEAMLATIYQVPDAALINA